MRLGYRPTHRLPHCPYFSSVDHVGVSNAQLVKEKVPLAAHYNDRSVAEQNSLDLSWDLLMSDDYVDLRAFLFQTQEELVRFRQLVVNVRERLFEDICQVLIYHPNLT